LQNLEIQDAFLSKDFPSGKTKSKIQNGKTKGKNQKSTNKFLDENRKTKIEIFFKDSEPVDFFCQRVIKRFNF